ncbi:hypothetical protein DINM_000717 [Dirofilaria immitis]|nr:hypothetical protein [Dirofilaria immitis]
MIRGDENYLRQLSRIEHLNVLTIASSLLNLLSLSCLDALCTKKLRKLYILQRYDEMKTIRNILRQSQLMQIISAPLVTLQISGVILKADIFSKLCKALKQTLVELLIAGALCNSPDFDQYISAIVYHKNGHLKNIKPQKISVYVHYYNAPNIADFLNTLPKTLEELVLFRTTELDQTTWSKDFDKLPFKVYLCRLDDIIFEPPWMCDRNELLSHTLWLPPYNFAHNFSRTDLSAEWYQDVLSMVEEVNDHQEPTTAQSNSISTSRNEFVNLSLSNESTTAVNSISAQTIQSFEENGRG